MRGDGSRLHGRRFNSFISRFVSLRHSDSTAYQIRIRVVCSPSRG